MISNEQFSGLIGRIYDCALDPDRWPETMRDICAELECLYGGLLVIDPGQARHQFVKTWNTPPDWMARRNQYNQDVTRIVSGSSQIVGDRVFDEPVILSRHLPKEIRGDTRYFREWAEPQGICDAIYTVVLREPPRVGLFSAVRHESVGQATDREMEIMQLLAPHIRRAVTISDIMDMRKLEAQALAATLDAYAAGIVVVADDSRILHANHAARDMFARREIIRSVNGRLATGDGVADAALAQAIAIARRNEPEIGAAGIGVALPSAAGEPAIAHVLPLAHGDLRTRLVPQATAAVFVTHASLRYAIDIGAIAVSLGLTHAEAQLLEQLTGGATLANAALALGIAETTAKTHLSHIFGKTGVSRQADLIALVRRLSPPLRGSSYAVT